MKKSDFKLLDCTLRDGGYINNWCWGGKEAQAIINLLVKAGIDIIEVGFLRNEEKFKSDITIAKKIEDLNKLIAEQKNDDVMYAAMAMRSNYDVSNLSPYCGTGIELIRVTAHDYDLEEGLEFARQVKEKNYKVSINPINIMGYSDAEILKIINKVNEIQPYQFAIVDTFGSMRRRDLERIVNLVDNNLNRNIRLALHLHENMSLGCSLAQSFLDKHLNRSIAIDASLMGMGRNPGNLPIELIADYLNENWDTLYDIDYLMDAIQDYIAPLRGNSAWGYNPTYFLSARFNLHRNYAEYLMKTGDLTNRDINHILSRVERTKATVFDEKYINKLYREYLDNRIDDTLARKELKMLLAGRRILIIAPGSSIVTEREKVLKYIEQNRPIIISMNFTPDFIPVDFTFCSNNKRYRTLVDRSSKTIVTSNIEDAKIDYRIDFNSVSGSFEQGTNCAVLLLRLLKSLGVENVAAAGMDGYYIDKTNYYLSKLKSYAEYGNNYNLAVARAIRNSGMKPTYITESAYDIEV